MPLVKVGEMLREAKKEQRCVAAFNCHNYEAIKCVIDAGAALRAPVIVMLYPTVISHIPLSTFALITKDLAEKSRYPVGLHLDHSCDPDFILEAVKAGFQSVIVDASRFDYETNVRLTRQVVEAVRPLGADIEAEIGFVGAAGSAEDYTDAAKYTDPQEAKRFMEDTQVDTLAIAIGNAHGHYVVEPRLDISVLKEINRLVDVPLVLHGGSGIPDSQLKDAVKNGIAKANYGTDFGRYIFAAQEAYMYGDGEGKHAFGLLKAGEDGGREYAEGRIRVLGGYSTGKPTPL